MISSKLQQHFINKKVRKLLAEDTMRKKDEVNKKIISVGILTKEEFYGKFDLQRAVTEQLTLRNPKIYSYRKFDKHQEQSFKHFTEKDLNWKAEVIEPSFQNFLNESFDLLICYFIKPDAILEYTALLSKASFKVGFAGVNASLFDLEIALPSTEMNDFFFEVQKYLKILKKI